MSFQALELPTMGLGDRLSNLEDKELHNPKFLLLALLRGALRNRRQVGRVLGSCLNGVHFMGRFLLSAVGKERMTHGDPSPSQSLLRCN